ncbi:AAA ATPase central domain protein [Burkholderiales bacterium GJ-E10]|nr:AAA ATPase central domain protein [Burkholderiales bacterium GJ-E10]
MGVEAAADPLQMPSSDEVKMARTTVVRVPDGRDFVESGFRKLGDVASEMASVDLLVPAMALESIRERKRQKKEEAAQALAATAPAAPAAAIIKKPARARARAVSVFSAKALERARHDWKEISDSPHPLLNQAARNDGFRSVPKIRPALKRLDVLQQEHANMRAVIETLRVDLALSSAMPRGDFRVRPILLVGDPGTGKTYFALKVAEALGVPMQKWSAALAQGGFQLTGSSSDWRNGKHGLILDVFAKDASAAPMFLFDEVDKIGSDDRYPVVPVLLDLLEQSTARIWRDEFFRMEFDVSRMIVLMTANSLDRVPAPLQSRVEVFHVQAPGPAQRTRMIEDEIERLNRKTRRRLEIDQAAVKALAMEAGDLRQTMRAVVDAFAAALMAGERVVVPIDPGQAGRDRGQRPAVH